MTTWPERNQSLPLSCLTLATLVAFAINNSSHSELLGAFKTAIPAINIKSSLPNSRGKDVLEKED